MGDWTSLSYAGQPIACVSLKNRPWVYIMESLNGLVRKLVNANEIIYS